MADAGRRGVQLDQAAGGVAVDPAPPVGRDVVEQRVADEAVAEAVAGARRLDDQRGEGVVEVVERLLLGQPGQRDELVGVERRADDGHTLEHLAGRRCDAADHVGVERLHPARFVGGAAGELVHRERDAAAERRRSASTSSAVGFGDVAADERRHVVVVERTELELGRSMPVDQALACLGQRVGQRRRPVGEHDAHPLVVRRAGDVVEQPQAGVVGVVDVVDGEQQAVRGRRQADQLGCGHEQPLVRTARRSTSISAPARARSISSR